MIQSTKILFINRILNFSRLWVWSFFFSAGASFPSIFRRNWKKYARNHHFSSGGWNYVIRIDISIPLSPMVISLCIVKYWNRVWMISNWHKLRPTQWPCNNKSLFFIQSCDFFLSPNACLKLRTFNLDWSIIKWQQAEKPSFVSLLASLYPSHSLTWCRFKSNFNLQHMQHVWWMKTHSIVRTIKIFCFEGRFCGSKNIWSFIEKGPQSLNIPHNRLEESFELKNWEINSIGLQQ